MSPLGMLESEVTVVPTFGKAAPGLWDAIVVQIALRDPAGSSLAGPSWPGRPVGAEPGMFDFVRTAVDSSGF